MYLPLKPPSRNFGPLYQKYERYRYLPAHIRMVSTNESLCYYVPQLKVQMYLYFDPYCTGTGTATYVRISSVVSWIWIRIIWLDPDSQVCLTHGYDHRNIFYWLRRVREKKTVFKVFSFFVLITKSVPVLFVRPLIDLNFFCKSFVW